MDVAVARNLYVARDADDASAALAEQASVHSRIIERSRGGSTRSHVMAYANQLGATEAAALPDVRLDPVPLLQRSQRAQPAPPASATSR